MPGMTLEINSKSPLHKKLIEELTSRIKMAEKRHGDRHEQWTKAEQVVAAYVPENSDDANRRLDRDGKGTPRYTTIKIPYTYALLMTAHTYWTSVFLSRTPVHQYQGLNGEGEQQVLALEALIGYQTMIGKMLAPYYLWLYDVGKYGVGWLGTYWCQEMGSYSQLDVNERGEQVYVTRELIGYTGNRVYNISPFDALPDPRVPVNRFQEGEFFAVYRAISWNDLVAREAQGYYTNVELVKKTPNRRTKGSDGYLERPDGVDDIGVGNKKHPAWVGVYEVYVTLIPDDWDLGTMKMPEKWVFTVTSDFELVLQAQPLGAIHNRYPFAVVESEPEAYGLWNRGIPEIVEPLQNTMDWLVNTHFYNVRAIGSGRYIADPSKIDLSQLESGEPGWIAALRPEAWGTVTDIRQVFQQIQLTDPTAMHMTDFDRMFQIGERTMGIGESMMGAMSGGRKTASEVRTTTGFGVSRLKSISEYMSATGFQDHSMMLVQNSQQYFDQQMKLRIVGDQAMLAGESFVTVDPAAISGFYGIVPVDGTLPVDRFAQATLWKDLLGQFRVMPELMMQYDIGRIFAWVAQLAGLKNLNQFAKPPQVQVLPDEQLANEAQRGNIIPMPKGPGTQSNVAALPTTNVGPSL